MQLLKRFYPLLLLTFFLLLATTSLIQKSATFDETRYLGIGQYLLTHGKRDISQAILHPHLSHIIHGIPLLWVKIPESIWKEPNADRRGQKIIDLRSNDSILNAARIALLSIGVSLGWLVFLWSKALYGMRGGFISLTLFCFSPNILSHARLITPDLTLTYTTVLSAYCLWRLKEKPDHYHLLAAGISLGLLLHSKYTALVLIPILVMTDITCRIWSKGFTWRQPFRLFNEIRHWIILMAISLGILWAGYFFSTGFLEVSPGLKIPVIAVEYFEGAFFQWKQSRFPHEFFLMGDFSSHGWWYFYLLVLAIKIPIAIWALFFLLLSGRRWTGVHFEAREIYLWLPALLFLIYLSFFNTIHNGFRYLMPVYPFIFVFIGKYAQCWSKSSWIRPFVLGMLAWLAVACLWIWPDFLAYHNEWIGGPRKAYLWTSDSNLDWGQDLKQLKKYMDRKKIDKIQLAYFGTADPAHYDINYEYLPSPTSPLRRPLHSPEDQPKANIVALSAYQYQGVGFKNKSFYGFFHNYVPNDFVGYSILIFDLKNLIPRHSK